MRRATLHRGNRGNRGGALQHEEGEHTGPGLFERAFNDVIVVMDALGDNRVLRR